MRPRAEWDFYHGDYWDKRFGKKGPWSEDSPERQEAEKKLKEGKEQT